MFAASVRRVSHGGFDSFVSAVMCIERSATAALAGPRGPLVCRSHVLRGAASLGSSIDRSTASQQPAGHRCSRPQFVVFRARRLMRSSATRRAARLRASSPAIVIGRTDRGARCLTGAVSALRVACTARRMYCAPHVLRAACAARRSITLTVDRQQHGLAATGDRRCSRLRFVRGAPGHVPEVEPALDLVRTLVL